MQMASTVITATKVVPRLWVSPDSVLMSTSSIAAQQSALPSPADRSIDASARQWRVYRMKVTYVASTMPVATAMRSPAMLPASEASPAAAHTSAGMKTMSDETAPKSSATSVRVGSTSPRHTRPSSPVHSGLSEMKSIALAGLVLRNAMLKPIWLSICSNEANSTCPGAASVPSRAGPSPPSKHTPELMPMALAARYFQKMICQMLAPSIFAHRMNIASGVMTSTDSSAIARPLLRSAGTSLEARRGRCAGGGSYIDHVAA
mmetsp:Transcript_21789/g.50094  ORF Transcript_21789/g.50094 Transcript_21789/m.50094 type:complete len:261 (-) Transcript_21789:53-835(-)